MENSGDNVFRSIPVGKDEHSLLGQFLAEHDFAVNTRKAIIRDVRKFARWFWETNHVPFTLTRVTTRDVTDFRGHIRQNQLQMVSSVNRCLVTLRRFLGWLVEKGHLPVNPARPVKELKMQLLAPKGLERGQVRRLLREVELRQDLRAGAIFSLFLV